MYTTQFGLSATVYFWVMLTTATRTHTDKPLKMWFSDSDDHNTCKSIKTFILKSWPKNNTFSTITWVRESKKELGTMSEYQTHWNWIFLIILINSMINTQFKFMESFLFFLIENCTSKITFLAYFYTLCYDALSSYFVCNILCYFNIHIE